MGLPIDEIERQRERQRKQKDIRKFGTQLSQNMTHSQRTPLIVPSEQCRGNDLLKVLELHFKKIGRKVELSFKTIAKTNKNFYSTCVIDGVKGNGRGCTEKQAIQNAALDLIVKLKVPLKEKVERGEEFGDQQDFSISSILRKQRKLPRISESSSKPRLDIDACFLFPSQISSMEGMRDVDLLSAFLTYVKFEHG